MDSKNTAPLFTTAPPKSSGGSKWLLLLVLFVVAASFGLLIGYLVGNRTNAGDVSVITVGGSDDDDLGGKLEEGSVCLRNKNCISHNCGLLRRCKPCNKKGKEKGGCLRNSSCLSNYCHFGQCQAVNPLCEVNKIKKEKKERDF